MTPDERNPHEAFRSLFSSAFDANFETPHEAADDFLAELDRAGFSVVPKGEEPVAWLYQLNGAPPYVCTDRRDPMGWVETPLYRHPAPQAVPPGWKLVPIKATQAMLLAAGPGPHPDYMEKFWERMIAAAPPPAAVVPEGYVIAPVNPDAEIAFAGAAAFRDNNDGKNPEFTSDDVDRMARAYCAMLRIAAAPTRQEGE